MRQTFKKEERLCSRTLIKNVIDNGKSFSLPPFRIIWLGIEPKGNYPAEILFSVPKSNFSRAVDRNKIKRRMREAYRKHKQSMLYDALQENKKQIAIMLVYKSKQEIEYIEVQEKIILILQRLSKDTLSKNSQKRNRA